MKTNDKNINQNNNTFFDMKKILIMIAMIFMSCVSVNAGILIADQTTLISEMQNAKGGNVQYITIVPSIDEIIYGNESFNQTYDLRLEYPELHNNIYYQVENVALNTSITFIYAFNIGVTGVRYTQEYIMRELGGYTFKIENTEDGESALIYIDMPTASPPTPLYIQQEIPKGIPAVMNNFVDKTIEFLDINLAVWRILFYVFIGVVIIGAIVGLIILGIKIYEYASKHNIWSKMGKRSNHR